MRIVACLFNYLLANVLCFTRKGAKKERKQYFDLINMRVIIANHTTQFTRVHHHLHHFGICEEGERLVRKRLEKAEAGGIFGGRNAW